MLSSNPLASQSFEAFLFDMDGTILDSSAASERVWGTWAREKGIPTPPYHGRRVEDTMADLRGAGIDPVAGAAEVTARELTDLDGVVPIPGAVEFLSKLPPERWAVVTSAPRELALRRIRAAGLPLPQTIVSAEDVTTGKPSPDPFLAGARKLGVDPRRCLVFEDVDAGIRAGEAAGCSVLVIRHTNGATLTDRPGISDYVGLEPELVDGGLVLRP